METTWSTGPALVLQGLCKSFGKGRKKTHVLDELNLEIRPGEIFGFLGPNGAGKSTSIKLLLNFSRPDSGEIRVFGRRVGKEEFRQHLGYLAEFPIFYDHLTGAETLAYSARLSKVPRQDRQRRIPLLLERMNLSHAAHKKVRSYSKGMKQRLGMANALIHDPALLILDEPMSGLDPLGRHLMKELILELRDQGRTVFFSSHILSDISSLCDRIGILNRGRLLYAGDIETLYKERHSPDLERAFVALVEEDNRARAL